MTVPAELGYRMTRTSAATDTSSLDTATAIGIQLQRIRHFWPLVVLVTLGAVIAGAVSALIAEPTYTGRTVLLVSSPGRVPEEDAVMVRGYVDLFNDPAYQARLRDSTELPEGTTFEARTAAASSMVFVEATAGEYVDAKDAALALATNFRWDVDAVRRAERDASLEVLRNQLDERRALLTAGGDPGYTTQRIIELETTINQMQGDSTNQLQILQPDGGVSVSEPSLPQNVLFGLLGGLVLGSLAAVLAALFSHRLGTAHDVHTRTGVNPIAEVPRGGTPRRTRARNLRFTQLAARVSRRNLPRPATLAITSPTRTPATNQVAQAIAAYWAREGERVVLLRADVRDPAGIPDYNPPTDDSERDDTRHTVTVRIMAVGDLLADPDAPLNRDRFTCIVERLRSTADLIVIQTAPVAEDEFAHSTCVASDRTLLALDLLSGRVGTTRDAVDLLDDADVLGAVLVDPRDRRRLRLFRRAPAEPAVAVRFEQIRSLDTAATSSDGHRRNHDIAALMPHGHGMNP